jgi:hypothetical protein
VISTPLKNMKVSWDDEISNIWKNKIHVPNHQPDVFLNLQLPSLHWKPLVASEPVAIALSAERQTWRGTMFNGKNPPETGGFLPENRGFPAR